MCAGVNKDNVYSIDWEAINKLKIAVVGDVMLDRYVTGNSSRVSPEAPVLVVKKSAEQSQLGGAGNVTGNLIGLGAKASLFSVVGDDAAGVKVKELLEALGVSAEMLFIDKERPTTEKLRLIAQNQQIVRIDSESVNKISNHIENEIINKVSESISNYDAIIISDYQKGVCSPKLVQALIKLGLKQQIPIFVDSKAKDYSAFKGATCITPNVHEAGRVLGYEISRDEEVSGAASKLSTLFDIPNILITRGADGITLYRLGSATHYPVIAKQVFDVSGAGDTVIATLTTLITLGLNWETAVEVTNIAAGIAVGKLGTMPVLKDELICELYDRESNVSSGSKIISDSSLKALLAKWRNEGKKIVFTNGCFDILHEGHIELLEKAKSIGDILVVGLNSDQSVRRLKGDSRPVNNQFFRARLLSLMSVIDALIIFEQDTPREIVEIIRPDFLVKGSDYSESEIVGGDIVRSYGGEVILVPLINNNSTTAIIERIKRM